MDEERQPISFLSYLQAENIKLRQAVVDLSVDTWALRNALARRRSEPDANVRPQERRLRRRTNGAASSTRSAESPHR
jgi:hypothetical protein